MMEKYSIQLNTNLIYPLRAIVRGCSTPTSSKHTMDKEKKEKNRINHLKNLNNISEVGNISIN